MAMNEDLYATLGLTEGPAATFEAIRRAYRARALICHPDKRPDDPLAAADFQQLQKAYDVLSDEQARKSYDDLINARKARLEKESRADSKRRKMMEDLEKRESAARAQSKEKEEEERAIKRFQAEVARICATRGQRNAFSKPHSFKASDENQEKKNMLKVSWKFAKSEGIDYSAVVLNDHFSQFGTVEDIVILPKRSALVVMSSREEVLSASRQWHGSLVVKPLVPQTCSTFGTTSVLRSNESDKSAASLSASLVGKAFHDREDSILAKLKKKAEQMKSQGV